MSNKLSLTNWKHRISPILVARIFLAAVIFTIPFQIQSIVFDAFSYASGLYAPYSSFILHLGDICLLIAWGFFLYDRFKSKTKLQFGHSFLLTSILIFFVLIEISFFSALHKEIVFWHLIRLLFGFLFYLLLVNKLLPFRLVIKLLLASALLQVIIALMQFVFQHSLGLSFLGEHPLSPDIDGVAKIDTAQGKLIRGYGTLTHPNILGDFLAIIFLMTAFFERNLLFRILLLPGISLTVSRSALLTLVIAMLSYALFFKNPRFEIRRSLKKVVVTVGIIGIVYGLFSLYLSQFLQTESGALRLRYLNSAFSQMFEYPLGVGKGQFVFSMPVFGDYAFPPWEIQPVHNVFMLIGSELGIIAFLLSLFFFVYLFFLLWAKNQFREIKITLMIWVSLIVLLNCDHYFLTIYAGQMMIWIVMYVFNEALYMPSVRTIIDRYSPPDQYVDSQISRHRE